MEKTEEIKDFYLKKLSFIPDSLQTGAGHFNIFHLRDFVGTKARPIPYNRKEYYKISLIAGRNRYTYADKVIELTSPALLFANPMIPYKWEPLDEDQQGSFCVFTEAFLSQFGNIKEYPVFQVGSNPIYYPSAEELTEIQSLFNQLHQENNSGYIYRHDAIRALLLTIVHKAIKMMPAKALRQKESNANARITALFFELLERQFPLPPGNAQIGLRTPGDFSRHLAVHNNHLNRALKATRGKTTSQLISERLLQEARVMIRSTKANIAEIGYKLGFEEPSRFVSFFKKQTNQTPNAYRKLIAV